MEEILASIRRIIEDSDPGSTKQPESEPAAQQRAELPMGEGSVIEVEAFRDGLAREEADASNSEETQQPEPSLEVAPDVKSEMQRSMADIQASLDVDDQADDYDMPAMPQAEAAAPKMGAVTPDRPQSFMSRSQPEQFQSPQTEQFQAPKGPQAAASRPAPSPATAAASSETRPSIISEQAGRQVSAAFEELSEAFAASRRRSFDEMAEEMIRPMLREWMDNNLPVLVERLVREEIERVARGA